MLYNEFRRQLGKAGLSIREFACLLQLSPNSVSNHKIKGFVPNHMAIIAVLLGELADHRVDYRKKLAGIELEERANTKRHFNSRHPHTLVPARTERKDDHE